MATCNGQCEASLKIIAEGFRCMYKQGLVHLDVKGMLHGNTTDTINICLNSQQCITEDAEQLLKATDVCLSSEVLCEIGKF